MHVPQSLVTAVELQELAAVAKQIISVRECKPIIGIEQDVALGVYRFTKPGVTLNEKQMMNLLSSNPKADGTMPPPAYVNGEVKTWTGRQVMSTIIPPNVNLRAANKLFDDEKPDDKENFVVIENGVHKQGTMDKTIYQNRTRGLIHSIFNECSPEETRMFLDNTQKVICDWLVQSGFSVGISDIMIDAETDEEIKKMIRDMKVKVYDMIRDIHTNAFENTSINDNNEFFESQVNNILNTTSNKVGKIAKRDINDLENRMINMVNAGSKGSIINVSQMIACLGQVNVDGKRIAYGFDDRTLPHYPKHDDGPESRGFVENSFNKGLTPQEFFMHAMGGREGLIDTAVKTSETGYLQRKLVKAMEDAKVSYDHTVRIASGNVVQFLYGEDGMDASKIENQPLIYIEKNLNQLMNDYLLSSADDLKHYLSDETLKAFHATPDWEARFEAHYKQVLADREYIITKMFNGRKETSLLYPISFMRLINNARAVFRKGALSDLNPAYALDQIEALGEELYVSKANRGNMVLKMLLRCYLSPKKVALEYRFDKATFEMILEQIRYKFYDAIAHPSEMVGVIAAQSIGEPSTQMTLNTFHLSGVSSASKAVRGVPRIKELLSCTRNIKTPALTIYLKDAYKKDKMKAKEVLNTIQTTYFSDIVRSTNIYYDPDDFSTTIEDDRFFVESYREYVHQERIDVKNLSPWLLRLEFDKDRMLEYDISMLEVYNALQEFYEDEISVMFSDDNATNLVFRIKLSDASSEDVITNLKALEKNILENLIVKGVRKVSKVIMNKNEYPAYKPDTLAFDATHEWVLETSGTNLLEILAHRSVDAARTVSNDINEIYETLGIEAARQALFNEISDVIKYADLYVNYRHLALLVDTMTNKGYLLSIDRHGINRVDIGPLAKSSFEETNDMIIKAGVFSEVDKINGVSANIMLGQIPPCGTGDTEILIDEAKLPSVLVAPKEPEPDPEEVCQNISIGYSAPAVPAAPQKKKKQAVKIV